MSAAVTYAIVAVCLLVLLLLYLATVRPVSATLSEEPDHNEPLV